LIVLDTHIWVWWLHGDSRLSEAHELLIKENEENGIGICTITLWEVAKLTELARLVLPVALDHWFASALTYPGMMLLNLTPAIATESTQLPGDFHSDPADQIIVATARLLDSPLITVDQQLRNYPQVSTP